MSAAIENNSKQFYRSVFSMVIPMALQNLINVAVTSADVIMLGRVGETALAGSSQAGQVQFIMTLIFFGLTSGASVLTAQYWGKKDTATIEKVMGITMRFSVLAALVFTVVVLAFPVQVMRIFTPDEPVIAEGVKYLRIIAFSYVMMSVTMVYLNIMRSVERVVVSTLVYLMSLVINILLNAVLIFGMFGFPALGIRGAAIATLIARAAELAAVLIYARRNTVVRLRFKNLFVRDALLFRDFLRFSIPVTMNEMMWGLGASTNAMILGRLGESVIAANSVAQVTRQLATVVSFGLAGATAILLGKSIGEGKVEEAQNNSRRLIKLTLITGCIGAVIVLIVRPIAIANLSLSATAAAHLSMMMLVMSYFVIAQAYNTTQIVGILRSGGDTKFGFFLDVLTMWGFSILLGALAAFVFKWSVPVVYILLMSDELLKIPFSTWRYKTKIWLRNVTR